MNTMQGTFSRRALACFLASVLSVTVFTTSTQAAEPANKKANAATRDLVDYFNKISAQKEGRRIVSGQFSDFGNGASLEIMTKIYNRTGKWPGLLGVDYADFPNGSLTWKKPNEAAIEYWKKGGLVAISAHLYNPANPKGGGLRDKGVDLNDLLKQDTETNKRWMHELDQIAEGLQNLKDAGVVVLWRPFHEMNGDWFWWGAKDPESFKKVWQHMFDYFSNTKKLDNLVWVYGPNHGENTAKYYAGDAYVDLVGLDAYTDFIDRQHIKGFSEIIALGKPFGFSEFGPRDPHNPPGDYDFLRFLDGIQKEFPETCYFMCWNWKWSLAWNQKTRELLAQPAIINRDNIPPFGR